MKRLAVLGVAVLASQLLAGVPQRLALWRDVARFARLPDDAARRAAARAPAPTALLAGVKRETPASARILLVTAGTRGAGDPDDVLFHRALVDWYPRAVRWVKPAPAQGWPVWWTPAPGDPAAVARIARAWRATHVVTVPASGDATIRALQAPRGRP